MLPLSSYPRSHSTQDIGVTRTPNSVNLPHDHDNTTCPSLLYSKTIKKHKLDCWRIQIVLNFCYLYKISGTRRRCQIVFQQNIHWPCSLPPCRCPPGRSYTQRVEFFLFQPRLCSFSIFCFGCRWKFALLKICWSAKQTYWAYIETGLFWLDNLPAYCVGYAIFYEHCPLSFSCKGKQTKQQQWSPL